MRDATADMRRIRVLGVHPIAAREPVHLIEIEVQGADDFDFGQVTEGMPDQPKENWQVAYDEREIASEGAKRFAFFFHHLDFGAQLETPFGPVSLPAATPIPSHLNTITYEEP
jgi:hypothetical protein